MNLYSFASSIHIYYLINVSGKEGEGRHHKKDKNLFTHHGPLRDLNEELLKSNPSLDADDLDDLDNEVAMILQKAPKSQQKSPENSQKGKSESGEESKKNSFLNTSQKKSSLNESFKNKAPVASITIGGAKGIQSKLNLIPLFNIKSLFLRNQRLEEALEIEYMTGISLM